MRNVGRSRICFISIFSAQLLFVGCGAKSGSGNSLGGGLSNETYTETVAAGTAALAGASNGAATGGGAISRWIRRGASPALAWNLFSSRAADATVTTCGTPAANDSCSSGVKSATYTNCAIPGTSQIYNGTVTLTFSSATCALSSANETVTRVVNVTRSGVLGTTLTTNTGPYTDFNGNTISGGTKLTVANPATPTYTLDVPGIHKTRKTSDGTTVQDVSIRTTVPFSITGSLAGGSRTVGGGTLEVTHNLAKYVAKFTPASPLTFSDAGSCCHPTSGTLNISYSGNVTGTGTLVYSSTCGVATLTVNGTVFKNVALLGCE